jgi:hypothetical protein
MATSPQHKYEVWASNALYLAFAVSLAFHFLLQSGYFAPHKSAADILWLYAANPFMLGVYYFIRQGIYGAKTLYLALYGLVILQLCAAIILSFVTDNLVVSDREIVLKLIGVLAEQTLKIGACVLILKSMRQASAPGIATAHA